MGRQVIWPQKRNWKKKIRKIQQVQNKCTIQNTKNAFISKL
jgi:hypothetical protein